jgi:polyisoprenoid-binding protein YceI
MNPLRKALATTIVAVSLFVAACGTPAVNNTGLTQSSTTAALPTTNATPASAKSDVTAPTSMASSTATTASTSTTASTAAASTDTSTYNVVANGTKADYRVREQLAKLNAPSDAIGTTTGVTGQIVIGADGKIVSDQSKLVVDLTKLQSDSNMRDGYIARGTLETSTYPTATFVPMAISGLSSPLPTSGQQSFQLSGNLTIHGVTKPITWTVTTQVSGNDVTGSATTSFKFEDFGMSPPQSMMVLSVVDNVTLEVTLHLTKAG